MKKSFYRALAYSLRKAGFARAGWNVFFSHVAQYGGGHPALAEWLSIVANGGSVVEHGCGVGTLPRQLRTGAFRSFVGYDICDEAIERASAQRLERCQFKRGSLEEWEGEGEPVDLIICKEVVYYLTASELRAFIGRAIAALAPAGRLVITFHDAVKHAPSLAICREFGAVDVMQGPPLVVQIRKAAFASHPR